MRSIFASSLLWVLIVSGCSLIDSPSSPRPTATLPSPEPSVRSPEPTPASGIFPVRGSAREIGDRIHLVPGPAESLYVSISADGSSVLVLLDPGGRPQAGWPVVLADTSDCALLSTVADGSVRVVCSDGEAQGVRAFAFGPDGRLFPGWPVDLQDATGRADQRVIRDELTVIAYEGTGEVHPETGNPFIESWLVTLVPDAALRAGVRVRGVLGADWRLGPDGIAYGVEHPGDGSGQPAVSRITAFDLDGVRAGWPVAIEGVGSAPAFGPGGSILLTVGSYERSTSRTIAFDRDAQPISIGSRELPIATAQSHSEGVIHPASPVVAEDGTTYVVGDLDGTTTVYALDSSGQVMDGWPYRAASQLIHPGFCPPESELGCPFPPARAVVGQGNVAYLLPAPHLTSGGSVVALGPDSAVHAGWPVVLGRPGAEFWSVVSGPDGTVYALAIEPEADDRSSATIFAIGPDGSVRYRITVVEP